MALGQKGIRKSIIISVKKFTEEMGVRYMQAWEEKGQEREEGRSEGRAEGRVEGRAEGRNEGIEYNVPIDVDTLRRRVP